tara:strand:+ start:5925 stop:6704 length:780 start_codon:yes stop_codon:yes gene_type:complete
MELITLLDQKQHTKAELLNKMADDDFYYGELGQLALSSSAIKLLYDSPKKYHYVTQYGGQETQGLRDGWLLHCLLLEPTKFSEQIFLDVQSKNTKAYKEAVKESAGRVFTAKEKRDAERLADAVLKNEQALRLLDNSQFEVPVIGNVMGMPFRGKADVLNQNGICDIKTTSDIKAFPYAAKKYGYDIQVFLYCELFGVQYFDFKFLVIDKSSLDVGIWDCSEEFYLSGQQKVKHGIATYTKYFMKEDVDVDNYIIKGTL